MEESDRVSVVQLDWEHLDQCPTQLDDVNVILAADCIYDPALITIFVTALSHLLTSHPTRTAYIASTQRNTETTQHFLTQLAQHPLTVTTITTNVPALFAIPSLRATPLHIHAIHATSLS